MILNEITNASDKELEKIKKKIFAAKPKRQVYILDGKFHWHLYHTGFLKEKPKVYPEDPTKIIMEF